MSDDEHSSALLLAERCGTQTNGGELQMLWLNVYANTGIQQNGAHPELCIVSLTSRSVDSFGVADDGYSTVASIHIISQSCRGISHRL